MKAGGGVKGSIRLEGAKQLQRKLNELDKAVAKKISRTALRGGAKVIHAAAKQDAPKRSGLLKRSLKVRSGKAKKGRILFVVQTKDGDFKGETFYGAFLEYGHKAGSRKLDNRKDVEPKPFLGPAFDAKKDDAVRTITELLRQGIKQHAK